MATSLTNPEHFKSRGGIDRRKILAGTAALAASAVTAANAATVAPLGQTGAPTPASEPLPLGPLPGSRYPDSHLEPGKKPSKPTFGPNGFPAFAGTMVWGGDTREDIGLYSRGCPAAVECASFLPQCKMKMEARWSPRATRLRQRLRRGKGAGAPKL